MATGWFVVPPTAQLTSEAQRLWRSIFGGGSNTDTVVEASGTAYTNWVKAGLHPYPSKAAAQAALPKANKSQNLGAAGSGGSVFGVHFAAGALRSMVTRTVKVILGVAMVLIGVGHLTGASKALTKVAKTAGLAAVA
jgi:hypothetical protein